MNTMIPNEIRFGLDLQDLPVRASHISIEKLVITGAQQIINEVPVLCTKAFRPKVGYRVGGKGENTCPGLCKSQGSPNTDPDSYYVWTGLITKSDNNTACECVGYCL
jgi:hypothetical protein